MVSDIDSEGNLDPYADDHDVTDDVVMLDEYEHSQISEMTDIVEDANSVNQPDDQD